MGGWGVGAWEVGSGGGQGAGGMGSGEELVRHGGNWLDTPARPPAELVRLPLTRKSSSDSFSHSYTQFHIASEPVLSHRTGGDFHTKFQSYAVYGVRVFRVCSPFNEYAVRLHDCHILLLSYSSVLSMSPYARSVVSREAVLCCSRGAVSLRVGVPFLYV